MLAGLCSNGVCLLATTTQEDIARWLGTRGIGTPASQVQRLTQYGFDVNYGVGSMSDLTVWLARGVPSIVFLRTGDLPYWSVDTPHAVVVAGLEGGNAYLFDPGIEEAPMSVAGNALMLAWSHFDYSYAVLSLAE